MMQLTALQVRAYKGAAASILLLYLVEMRPYSQGEMRRYTGYADEAVNDAMLLLQDAGMVIQTGRYLWALANGVQQLPIGAVDALPEGPEAAMPELGPDDPELVLNESMNESLTDSIEDDSFIDDAASSGNSGPDEAVTAKALNELGFYGRGIADMLRIPGLTMAEVRSQVEHSPSLGAALARIKKRQAWKQRERDGPSDRREYVGGQFFEFINH